MRNSGNVGFTLLEVGLAISIGLIASSALIAFYYQVKDDAGDAEMKQRIGSLKSLVEALYTAQGSCPTLGTVRTAWRAKRPNDYLTSPWGGAIYDPQSWNGIGGSDIASGTVMGWSTENMMSSGALYYYRLYDTAISGATFSTMLASASLWDQPLKLQVDIMGYGVAGLKSTNRHYMVTSGR